MNYTRVLPSGKGSLPSAAPEVVFSELLTLLLPVKTASLYVGDLPYNDKDAKPHFETTFNRDKPLRKNEATRLGENGTIGYLRVRSNKSVPNNEAEQETKANRKAVQVMPDLTETWLSSSEDFLRAGTGLPSSAEDAQRRKGGM